MAYIEAFREHIKVRDTHNEDVGNHPVLASVALLERHNINGYVKIITIIPSPTSRQGVYDWNSLFLSGADNLGYKKLKTKLNNNYITRLDIYTQYLLVIIKLFNKYISEIRNN